MNAPPVCVHCGEGFGPDEGAYPMATLRKPGGYGCEHIHGECLFRLVNGSAAHIAGRCSCFDPTSCENDDPKLSPREAARAARAAWDFRHRWPKH